IVSQNRERNDRKSGGKQAFAGRPGGRSDAAGKGPKAPASGGPGRGGWNPNPSARATDSAPRPPRGGKADADNYVWGRHPVLAALANPARRGMGRLLATADRAAELERDN